MVFILRCDNSEVTDYYLQIVGEMFTRAGETVEICHSIESCRDRSIILVVSTVTEFVRAYRAGYRNIFMWVQGIISEESYMNHRSRLRKFVLDRLTKFSLKKAKGIFYVSETMRRFEDEKFGLDTVEKSFLMPCFNTPIDKSSFACPDKYNRNVFSYVGSLYKWQCFEETVAFYKAVEEIIPDAELRVYTFSREEAEAILDAQGVRHYVVDCVPPDQMTKALAQVKFGFVLREDISVNNVATPTKLSSYMASGVIPVFSDCLRDFAEHSKNLQYAVPVENDWAIPDALRDLCAQSPDPRAVLAEYTAFFDRYYNREHYIRSAADWMKRRLADCKSGDELRKG